MLHTVSTSFSPFAKAQVFFTSVCDSCAGCQIESHRGVMDDDVAEEDIELLFIVENKKFKTTLHTLRAHPNSLLSGLCEDCPQSIGWGGPIRIHRTAEAFEWILSLYRWVKCGKGYLCVHSLWSDEYWQDTYLGKDDDVL